MPNRTQVIKGIIYVLGLLAVNALVSYAAMLAFVLFLLRGDPILAAVPALFALPAIVLQPWFVVFFLVPTGVIIKSVLTTLLTIFVYGWLNAGGALERPKRFLLRFKTRRMLAVAGGFVLLAVSVAVARHMDFPALNHGLPPSVQFLGLNVTDSRYYCLGQFIDSEWVWQARLPESELARLEERFKLRPVDRSELPDQFRSMPPYWWRPSITERTRVLSTPSFPLHERGPDGWYALATWNPEDQVLHVWIKDNF
jgi:hypothetical protein